MHGLLDEIGKQKREAARYKEAMETAERHLKVLEAEKEEQKTREQEQIDGLTLKAEELQTQVKSRDQAIKRLESKVRNRMAIVQR